MQMDISIGYRLSAAPLAPGVHSQSCVVVFAADLSRYIRPKQHLYALRMKACRCMKPVIVPMACTSPRMAPLFDGSAAAISHLSQVCSII